MHLSSHQYVPHARPISYFLDFVILMTFLSDRDLDVLTMQSSLLPCSLALLTAKYLLPHPILQHSLCSFPTDSNSKYR